MCVYVCVCVCVCVHLCFLRFSLSLTLYTDISDKENEKKEIVFLYISVVFRLLQKNEKRIKPVKHRLKIYPAWQSTFGRV